MKKGILSVIGGCILIILFVLLAESGINKPAVATITDVAPHGRSVAEISAEDPESSQRGGDPVQSYEELGIWTIEDFDHIQIGVSTKEDLLQISHRHTAYQRGRGEILQFALEDGRVREFVCKNGVVTEISFRG